MAYSVTYALTLLQIIEKIFEIRISDQNIDYQTIGIVTLNDEGFMKTIESMQFIRFPKPSLYNSQTISTDFFNQNTFK